MLGALLLSYCKCFLPGMGETVPPPRFPDYRAESRAIEMLVSTMSEATHEFWQSLAETALQLCTAGTAGVSLLATGSGEEVLRVKAVAGLLSASIPNTIPRDAIPCGVAMVRVGCKSCVCLNDFSPG
jgi:hypothetical protein